MGAWRGIWAGALGGVLGIVLAVPARADVIAQTDQGFVSRNVMVMAGSPAVVWKRLVTPSGWWSSDHTFSGDAANLSIDPVAGGCFCEKLPADEDGHAKAGAAAHAPTRGGVEHMRVVFVDHAKALRMVGALGPLQSEAVNGTLTITVTQVDGGTRVIFEYVVGGYMRYPPDKIATAVDTVMYNQLLSLARQFGPVAEPRSEGGTAGPRDQGGVAGPAAPSGQPAAGGLDRNGVLLPRGKVWSLPSGPPPEAPAPIADAPVVAPLPTAPVQDDSAPSGGTTPARKRAQHKQAAPVPPPAPAPAPEPQPTAPAPDSPPAPAVEAPAEPAPAPEPKAKATAKKKAAKPAPKAKPASEPDEPSKDAVDSAFDAAFGGGARPAASPQ